MRSKARTALASADTPATNCRDIKATGRDKTSTRTVV